MALDISKLAYWRSPVFVIGTGRCGSTLLRKVLTSHPQLLVVADECNDLWHPRLYPYADRVIDAPAFHSSPRKFTEISLKNWPRYQPMLIRAKLARFALQHPGRRALVVKSPMLTFMCVRLLELFPLSRFIFLYRDGESTSRSWVAKDYEKKWSSTCTRDEYANVVREFWAETMDHMSEFESSGLVNDGNFKRLRYEELCSNPNAVLEEMADFMGVDPNCYSFDMGSIENQNGRHGVIELTQKSSSKFRSWMEQLGYAESIA